MGRLPVRCKAVKAASRKAPRVWAEYWHSDVSFLHCHVYYMAFQFNVTFLMRNTENTAQCSLCLSGVGLEIEITEKEFRWSLRQAHGVWLGRRVQPADFHRPECEQTDSEHWNPPGTVFSCLIPALNAQRERFKWSATSWPRRVETCTRGFVPFKYCETLVESEYVAANRSDRTSWSFCPFELSHFIKKYRPEINDLGVISKLFKLILCSTPPRRTICPKDARHQKPRVNRLLSRPNRRFGAVLLVGEITNNLVLPSWRLSTCILTISSIKKNFKRST